MVAQIDLVYAGTRPRKALGRLLAWSLLEGRPLTTRGQWINPLVLGLHRRASRKPGRLEEPPIFITGTGRSGTTVLGVVMSLHADLLFLNEPKAMWSILCQREDLVGSYHNGPSRWRLTAEDARAARGSLAAIYNQALTLAGGRRVLDKYPELLFRRDYVRSLAPGARFLFLMRHGADVCGSVAEWSRRKAVRTGSERHDWWGRDGRKWHLLVNQLVPGHADLAPHAAWLAECRDDADRAAVEWIVSMREGQAAMDASEPDVLPVRYEQLVADPEQALNEILDFCGLPPDTAVLDYARKVLRPVPDRGPVGLDRRLVAPMRRTLRALGYDGDERVQPRQ